MHHVDAAIAVEIDAVLEVVARRELRRPELSGPVADHLIRPQIAALDDAQRAHELVAEKVRPPAVVGQGRDRSDDVVGAALVGAVVAFEAPQRDHHGRRYAGPLLDARQQRGVRL
jgi:hypothetical protein